VHKTQSSVSYSVQKIEQLLELPLFAKQGRKAVLTPAGEMLYRRAKSLLERADALERGAAALGADWDPELRLAVDIVFPTWVLLHRWNASASSGRTLCPAENRAGRSRTAS
jgi:DNA-binding transcriptional LysR family regulator